MVYLRKPSWLANYYDALNNRIRNLRDPSQAGMRLLKEYTDNTVNQELSGQNCSGPCSAGEY